MNLPQAQTELRAYRAIHFAYRTDEDGRVATITLSRPERKNPLTFESYAELRDLFRALALASDVKAVVITGAGGNFSSGGDVHDIIGPLTRMTPAELEDFTRMTGDLVKAMRHCPQPIVAAVDGVCAGAGAMVALASDLRIGTPSARTAFLFVRVGQGRAAELLYTGRVMTADEGLAWGFFNRLAAPQMVLGEAQALARSLADGPTFAHAMTKEMLHREWAMPVDAAIDAEAVAQAICMQSADFHRAYEAFIARQTPRFEGK